MKNDYIQMQKKGFFLIAKGLVTLCVFSILLIGGALKAQQDPQYSQYMFNQLAINPAYAGSREALSTSIFLRNQWTGIKGSPKTETFSIHSPLKKKSVALGLTVIADEIGPKSSIGFLAAYAYRIKLGAGKLSMGLRVGAYQYTYNWNAISYKDQQDMYNSNGVNSVTVPTADAGAYYYTNSLYLGFSAEHLNYGRLTSETAMNGTVSQMQPHLFFTAGKALELSEKLIFNPSCMVKYTGNAPISADLNLSFLMMQRLWAGISIRSQYGIVGYTQFYINDKFKIGYAYEFGMNKVGRAGGATHELMLSYDIRLSKPPFFSPRYF